MISNKISIDIIKFLQEEKGHTNEYIASNMGISVSYINEILKNNKSLQSKHLINLKKNTSYSPRLLIAKAIPEEHFSKNIRKNIRMLKIMRKYRKK